jgi:SCY1-like protein 1
VNNDCKMVHANLQPASVFVTEAGDWKLGGFDLMFPHGTPAPEPTRNNADILPAAYRSPELGKRNWTMIEQADPWSIDSWSLGCLIYAVFNKSLKNVQQLSTPGAVPKALLSAYGQLLYTAVKGRLNPQKLVESKFFENDLVQTVDFLENLAVHTDADKQGFFQQFLPKIASLPPVRRPCRTDPLPPGH